MHTKVQFVTCLFGLTVANYVQAISCHDATCNAIGNVTTCLGVINTDVIAANLTTAMGLVQSQGLTCGSQQPGLQTHLLQFAVEYPGLYAIQTANIGEGDPTMQVMTCTGEIVGCNDEADETTHNSRLKLSLEPGVQYVAMINKYDSYENEVDFDLHITPECVSTSLSPSLCFGIKQEADLVTANLTLDGTTDQLVLPCGSQEIGLDDFVFPFEVASSGVYTISTENIGDSDTTLAIYDEQIHLLGCNDDVGLPDNLRAPQGPMNAADEQRLFAILLASVRSEVALRLNASTKYIGVVSKFNKHTLDLKFDVVIKPGTLPIDTPTSPETPSHDFSLMVGAIVGAVCAVLVTVVLLVTTARRFSISARTTKSEGVAATPDTEEIAAETVNRKTGQFEYDWKRRSIGLSEDKLESDNPLFAHPHPLLAPAIEAESDFA